MGKIRDWFNKQKRCGTLFDHSRRGLFRVLYSDGKKSQRFDYKTAKDYAEMFNGKVIHYNE